MPETKRDMTVVRLHWSGDEFWTFFNSIADVDNLEAGEEADADGFGVRVNGRIVSVGAVDAVTTRFDGPVFVHRVATKKKHRRNGYGRAVMQQLYGYYGPLTCRIHPDNEASIAMVRFIGMEKTGTYQNLDVFEHTSGG